MQTTLCLASHVLTVGRACQAALVIKMILQALYLFRPQPLNMPFFQKYKNGSILTIMPRFLEEPVCQLSCDKYALSRIKLELHLHSSVSTCTQEPDFLQYYTILFFRSG